ncbi:Tellurite resistance protein TehB [Persephonella hydrogeniphila]|uniref:Tellurite resistance protein TehB n=2 Tax=Persephonella hydrogeniphila TaxID=198703 RepID=A0A285NB11_9AQUI|nr:Tellurite resistance protein TehB [Persephonella hydrogeniphila]
MEKDKERWNKRYTEEEYPWKEPSKIVREFYNLSRKGKALDIASGLGRNAIFLYDKGFDVDAVDISDVALGRIKKERPEINTIQADLDIYNIPENSYDLIININYLNRRLIPQIKEGLKKGGVVIFETFTLKKGKEYMQPENKDYLLRPNELLHLFIDMYIVFYQEKDYVKPDGQRAFISSLVAIKNCDYFPK